jgi:hypothetical protein
MGGIAMTQGPIRRKAGMTAVMIATLAASIASIGLATQAAAAGDSGTGNGVAGSNGCGPLVTAFVQAEVAEGGRGGGRSIGGFASGACG